MQLRPDNFIMTGIPEIANETNELTKEEVVRVLEKRMKLPATTRGIFLEAVRLSWRGRWKEAPSNQSACGGWVESRGPSKREGPQRLKRV
jgi:hypothetical protein